MHLARAVVARNLIKSLRGRLHYLRAFHLSIGLVLFGGDMLSQPADQPLAPPSSRVWKSHMPMLRAKTA